MEINEQNARKIMIALAAVAGVLACVLVYVFISNNSLVKALEGEKQELTVQLIDQCRLGGVTDISIAATQDIP